MQNFKLKKLLLSKKLIIFILVSTIYPNQLKKMNLSSHLNGSEKFIGKTFSGEFYNSTKDKPLKDIIYFERILNGKAIIISHSVNDGEYGGKYIIMWNAEKNMVESYFFSTGGEIILSEATISANNIIIVEDFSKNGNRIKKVKKIYKLNKDGTLENKIKYFINNVWVNYHSMRYVQSDLAKVIFR